MKKLTVLVLTILMMIFAASAEGVMSGGWIPP